MRKTAHKGFTLLEILIAVTIMAITGIFSISNFRNFGESQYLKNSALDIQSLLKQAQTDATASVTCSTQTGVLWQIELANTTTLNLRCSASPNILKTLQINKVSQAVSIQSVISGRSVSCPLPLTISFKSQTGQADLGNTTCTPFPITITLTDSKTNSTKSITVEQGGRIYGQ